MENIRAFFTRSLAEAAKRLIGKRMTIAKARKNGNDRKADHFRSPIEERGFTFIGGVSSLCRRLSQIGEIARTVMSEFIAPGASALLRWNVRFARLVRREAGAGPASIGLREDFIELRVTSEPGCVDGFCEGFLLRLPIDLPKAGEPQRITIPAQRNANLTQKGPAQIGFADSTVFCEFAEILAPVAFAQKPERTTHRRVQGHGVSQNPACALATPAKKQEVVKSGVQAIGIPVLVGKC